MGIESVLAVLRAVYDGADYKPAIASRSLHKGTLSSTDRLVSRLKPAHLQDIRDNFKRCTRLGNPRPYRSTTPEEVYEPARPLTLAQWEEQKTEWRRKRAEEIQAIEKWHREAVKAALMRQIPQLLPLPNTCATMVVPGGTTALAMAAAMTTVPNLVPIGGSPQVAELLVETDTQTELAALPALQSSDERPNVERGFSAILSEREEELRQLPTNSWQSAAAAPNAIPGVVTIFDQTQTNLMAYEHNWRSPHRFGAINTAYGSDVTMLALDVGRVMPVYFANQRWLTVRRAGASFATDGGHGLFADRPFFNGDPIIPYFGEYDTHPSEASARYLMGPFGIELTDGKGTVAGYTNTTNVAKKLGMKGRLPLVVMESRSKARSWPREQSTPKRKRGERALVVPAGNARMSKKANPLVRTSGLKVFLITATQYIAEGEEILLQYSPHIPTAEEAGSSGRQAPDDNRTAADGLTSAEALSPFEAAAAERVAAAAHRDALLAFEEAFAEGQM